MRATAIEYRFRFVIIAAVFAVSLAMRRGPWVFPKACAVCWTSRTAPRWCATLGASAILIAVAAWFRTWSAAYLAANVIRGAEPRTETLISSLMARTATCATRSTSRSCSSRGASRSGALLRACVLLVALLVFVHRLIGLEERAFLHEQGDDYLAYCRAVPRCLWPSARPMVRPRRARRGGATPSPRSSSCGAASSRASRSRRRSAIASGWPSSARRSSRGSSRARGAGRARRRRRGRRRDAQARAPLFASLAGLVASAAHRADGAPVDVEGVGYGGTASGGWGVRAGRAFEIRRRRRGGSRANERDEGGPRARLRRRGDRGRGGLRLRARGLRRRVLERRIAHGPERRRRRRGRREDRLRLALVRVPARRERLRGLERYARSALHVLPSACLRVGPYDVLRGEIGLGSYDVPTTMPCRACGPASPTRRRARGARGARGGPRHVRRGAAACGPTSR